MREPMFPAGEFDVVEERTWLCEVDTGNGSARPTQ